MNFTCLAIFAFFVIPAVAAESQTSAEQIQQHLQAAQQALRANRPAKAIPEYEAIVKLDPNNLDAQVNLGTLLFFTGSYARAVPILRAVVRQKPDLWKTVALLGMAEKRLGDPAAATDLGNAFAHLTDDKVRVQTGMELIELEYASGDLNRAAGVAAVLRQLRPNDPDVIYMAHRIYSDLSDETTLAMVMAAPHSARMHQIMGQELARHGQTAAAIAQYREALKVAPQTPGLHFELAELLASSGEKADQQQVKQEYEAALAANPLDVKSECRLGDLDFRASDLKGAYDHFSRAVNLAPDDADANLGLGKTLLSMHETAKAMPLLERAVKDDPTNAVAHYRLGMAYRSAGKADAAARELAEFQKLKDLKEKLGDVYKSMMLKPGGHDSAADPDAPM